MHQHQHCLLFTLEKTLPTHISDYMSVLALNSFLDYLDEMLLCVSCSKRENDNYCAINDMIKLLFSFVWYICFVFISLCRYLLEKKKSSGSTTLPALDKKDQTISMRLLIQSAHIQTGRHKHALRTRLQLSKTHTHWLKPSGSPTSRSWSDEKENRKDWDKGKRKRQRERSKHYIC